MSSDGQRQGRTWDTPASLPGEDPRRSFRTTPRLTSPAALCYVSLWVSPVNCNRGFKTLTRTELKSASCAFYPLALVLLLEAVQNQ